MTGLMAKSFLSLAVFEAQIVSAYEERDAKARYSLFPIAFAQSELAEKIISNHYNNVIKMKCYYNFLKKGF
jgi:hypothetical protein